MRHDVGVTLRQMLTYVREAIDIAARTTRTDLGTEIVLTRSLVHTLEMIGEAARRVTAEDRARYPAVPWQDVVDLRNRLIHGYDQVDYDTVWQIVLDDLPKVAAELERITQALER
jgi:uncharacterized protein with HEPN domain